MHNKDLSWQIYNSWWSWVKREFILINESQTRRANSKIIDYNNLFDDIGKNI